MEMFGLCKLRIYSQPFKWVKPKQQTEHYYNLLVKQFTLRMTLRNY